MAMRQALEISGGVARISHHQSQLLVVSLHDISMEWHTSVHKHTRVAMLQRIRLHRLEDARAMITGLIKVAAKAGTSAPQDNSNDAWICTRP